MDIFQRMGTLETRRTHLSCILVGDTMVPNIEDHILLLGYSILYKEYYLTGLNHQKDTTHLRFRAPGRKGDGRGLWWGSAEMHIKESRRCLDFLGQVPKTYKP